MKQSSEVRKLGQHILSLTDKIYRQLEPGIPDEGFSTWLSSDLTVAQLRVMLMLHTYGPLRMSDIANRLHVAVSTTTGIMDKLVAKQMVVREADTEDRRRVICRLSPSGGKLMGGLWNVGRTQIARLIQGLTRDQLKSVTSVVEMLYANLESSSSVVGGRKV